jgi:hypothetical protein
MPFGPAPHPESQRKIDRFMWRLATLCVVLILCCGGLIFSLIAVNSARDTAEHAAATCDVWAIVAKSPVTDKSSPALFNLIGAGRKAYQGLGCEQRQGPLPSPDPRVKLPAGTH